jgi:hypothetical protein
LPGSVVYGSEKNEFRSAIFEPIVVAAVDLHKEAHLGFMLTGTMKLRRPVFLMAGYTNAFEDTSDRRRTDAYALVFEEQFTEESVIAPPVFSLSEMNDGLANMIWDGVDWFAASISVSEGCVAAVSEFSFKSVYLTLANSKDRGSIAVGNHAIHHLLKNK